MMHLLRAAVFITFSVAPVCSQGDPLEQPPTIESSNGLLDTTISFEYADFSGPFYSFSNTRLFNGIIPGPTLLLSAGDNLSILFQNDLQEQSGAITGIDNGLHDPDHSNLHFHGGHVSGELPSDDVRMRVAPGSSYQYFTNFPSNHLPGTHWIHPHGHGSSALQVGGGAAMAMIVQDPDGYLPSQVESATEQLMVVQNIDPNEINDVVSTIGDGMLQTSFTQNGAFRIVNGQYQPVVSMQPGEWQRWRIIWADYIGDNLDFAIDTACEMQLLAKDGIYIQDYPRTITVAPIPTGGRADIMIRCPTSGTYNVMDFDGQVLMTVEVSGIAVSSTDLVSWTPDYPAYLQDLTSTAATNGCDCRTSIRRCDDNFCINDELFDADVYLHTIAYGSVVERDIRGQDRHPYHQHVYPYQLVAGVDSLTDADDALYFQIGDWHDVIAIPDADPVTVRYVADVHDGVLMLHCHILTHEDEGTMAQELIIDGGDCACDALYIEPVESTVVPSAAPVASNILFVLCSVCL